MSRGHEGEQFIEKRLPVVTQHEVDMARHDYTQWQYEDQQRGRSGNIVSGLWDKVKDDKGELTTWLTPFLKYHYQGSQEEGDALTAGLAIMYDLLRRRGVAMKGIDITVEGAKKVMPPGNLPPARADDWDNYNKAVHELTELGERTIKFDQDYELVLKTIVDLLPRVLNFDPSSLTLDDQGNFTGLALQGAKIMYGCLRWQIDYPKQARGQK